MSNEDRIYELPTGYWAKRTGAWWNWGVTGGFHSGTVDSDGDAISACWAHRDVVVAGSRVADNARLAPISEAQAQEMNRTDPPPGYSVGQRKGPPGHWHWMANGVTSPGGWKSRRSAVDEAWSHRDTTATQGEDPAPELTDGWRREMDGNAVAACFCPPISQWATIDSDGLMRSWVYLKGGAKPVAPLRADVAEWLIAEWRKAGS